MDQENYEQRKSKIPALNVINSTLATNKALEEIEDNRGPYQMYLKTRYKKLNEILYGGFRFKQNILLAGSSGHGKSYFLKMLHQDFKNQQLNGNLKYPIKILHFNFEMETAHEILRELVGCTGISYADLLSATENLTDEKLELVKKTLKTIPDEIQYYVESTGNKYQIFKTIELFQNKFPNHKIITTLDHTLLVEKLDESGEIEILSDLAKMYIKIRKKLENINILLGQLNDKMEDVKRRENSSILNYPTKTDVFSSKQIFHAVDIAMVLNRPELFNIIYYGKHSRMTERLIALHILKSRTNFSGGYIKLLEDFANGKILNHPEDIKNNIKL